MELAVENLSVKYTPSLILGVDIRIPSNLKPWPATRKRKPIQTRYRLLAISPWTIHTMPRNLLPIRILFHASFGFVYLPIIWLGFSWGLTAYDSDVKPFVYSHFDGLVALAALMGLGIFAAL